MPRSPSRYMPAAEDRRMRPSPEKASKSRHISGSTGCQVGADWRDPNLLMMLAEPEVRLLMHPDRVDERELMATLRAISVQRSAGYEHLKPTD
jgi:hypothetical protein